MIPAIELRVGNWVTTSHGNVQVVSVGKYIVTTPNLIGATHGGFFDPISLERDVVEKIEGVDTTAIESSSTHTGCVYFKLDNQTELSVYYKDKRYFIGGKYQAPIHHLHQLQNLYFFLTGKELVVNIGHFSKTGTTPVETAVPVGSDYIQHKIGNKYIIGS